MPIVEHSAEVDATPEEAFDLSMSHARRFDWDPFISAQRFLDGASEPGVGVKTWVATSGAVSTRLPPHSIAE